MATNKKALCVGVNQFKNYPSAALQGCVNDANEMSALLQKLLGFQSGDITVLTDAQATKANIISKQKRENTLIWFSVCPVMVRRYRT